MRLDEDGFFLQSSIWTGTSQNGLCRTQNRSKTVFEVRREAPALLWKGHKKILAAQEIPRVRLCVCPQTDIGHDVLLEVLQVGLGVNSRAELISDIIND